MTTSQSRYDHHHRRHAPDLESGLALDMGVSKTSQSVFAGSYNEDSRYIW